MKLDVMPILDPEFVIPSVEKKRDLAFWQRMEKVASDTEPRLGLSTLNALLELISSPPVVAGLSNGDFWGIVAKYVHRGTPSVSRARTVCDEHVRTDYRPNKGAPTNADLLVSDLRDLGDHQRVALYTLSACWVGERDECRSCKDSRISHVLVDDRTFLGGANSKAAIRRIAYLEGAPTDMSSLATSAPVLFPQIEFAPGAWRNLGDLAGGAEENVRKLIEHLGVLNDYAAGIWRDSTSTDERQARLAGYGVTSSPESTQTHKNQKAMRSRDFKFESGTVRCEWHTKLRPNQNRIHFAVQGSRVMVGAIVDHLRT